jgi:hypothetical protein
VLGLGRSEKRQHGLVQKGTRELGRAQHRRETRPVAGLRSCAHQTRVQGSVKRGGAQPGVRGVVGGWRRQPPLSEKRKASRTRECLGASSREREGVKPKGGVVRDLG